MDFQRKKYCRRCDQMSLEIYPSKLVCGGVCAWPNLQKFGNGDLLAVFHNRPTHAQLEGELDLMISHDGGETWNGRQSLFPHKPGTCRCNHALGTFRDRAVVLCAGWLLPRKRQLIPCSAFSEDRGRTWQYFSEEAEGLSPLTWVPFGNIVHSDNGDLCMAAYLNLNGLVEAFFMRSADGGKSWKTFSRIADQCNETTIIHCGGGRWIAAVRTENLGILQYDSDDDGKNWHYVRQLTLRRQVTGCLTLLRDGRVVLSYGNRNEGHFGVDVRISESRGMDWADPFQLVSTAKEDCGYPSTVELSEDNSLLTLYYTQVDSEQAYELRSVRWKL